MKKSTHKKTSSTKSLPTPTVAPERGLFSFLPDFKQRAIALVVISFVLFANTLFNESALDDEIVLNKNQHVQEGIQGIGAILSEDAYSSYYASMQAEDQLVGGRYRPLSIVTFAIEEALFGFADGDEISFVENGKTYAGTIQQSIFDEKEVLVTDDNGSRKIKRVKTNTIDGYESIYHGRHFVNVLFYLLSLVVVFYLLHFVLLQQFRDVAFLALLIFAIHPIHTEVVANVKSRDEILSLLFIGLTFIYAFKWRENRKIRSLFAMCSWYFLALLSKEWGIVLTALLPIAYIVVRKETLGAALKASIPVFIVAFVYLLIRINVVGMGGSNNKVDISNDPYLFASGMETFATKTAVLFKYFMLQVFPHPLSADYSYKTIAYRNLASWDVWVSLLFHLGLIVWTVRLLIRKHVLGFALAFYLGPLFLVSNFVFDIGATMGERLVYHSSFGFSIVLAYFVIKGIQKLGPLNVQKRVFFPLLLLVVGLASFKTIERNGDWKNDATLFIHDVKVVPNSLLANSNAGKTYLEMAEKETYQSSEQERLLKTSEGYLMQVIELNPASYTAHLNLGYLWYLRNDLEKTEFYWKEAESHFSRANHPEYWQKYDNTLAAAFYNRGLLAAHEDAIEESRKYLEKAVEYAPRNVQYLEDLGGACFTLDDKETALRVWTTALSIDPARPNCRGGYRAITGKEWGQ